MREGERECVRERERERVRECVCGRERERVCVRERQNEGKGKIWRGFVSAAVWSRLSAVHIRPVWWRGTVDVTVTRARVRKTEGPTLLFKNQLALNSSQRLSADPELCLRSQTHTHTHAHTHTHTHTDKLKHTQTKRVSDTSRWIKQFHHDKNISLAPWFTVVMQHYAYNT